MVPLCTKPACSEPAVATLRFNYAAAQVWLVGGVEDDASTSERHPLCEDHADGMRVPNGWELVDERSQMDVIFTVGLPGAV